MVPSDCHNRCRGGSVHTERQGIQAQRRVLETAFAAAPTDDAALTLARAQAFQAQTNEQLLHMIHTILAAILAALLWR
jgi:hypothetical protein